MLNYTKNTLTYIQKQKKRIQPHSNLYQALIYICTAFRISACGKKILRLITCSYFKITNTAEKNKNKIKMVKLV